MLIIPEQNSIGKNYFTPTKTTNSASSKNAFFLGSEYITLLSEIKDLPNKKLKKPIKVIVEPDGDGFIAKTPKLPLYGYGDNKKEAVENLKYEIESLFDDLMEDDQFSEEWLNYKKFLKEIIAE